MLLIAQIISAVVAASRGHSLVTVTTLLAWAGFTGIFLGPLGAAGFILLVDVIVTVWLIFLALNPPEPA